MPANVSEVVREFLDLVADARIDLAESVEVSYASLHAWSTGRRAPNRENALKLARVAQDRAVRIAELARLLSDYARTGELIAGTGASGEPSGKLRSDDRETLGEIRARSRLLRQKVNETLAWVREHEELGLDEVESLADGRET